MDVKKREAREAKEENKSEGRRTKGREAKRRGENERKEGKEEKRKVSSSSLFLSSLVHQLSLLATADEETSIIPFITTCDEF